MILCNINEKDLVIVTKHTRDVDLPTSEAQSKGRCYFKLRSNKILNNWAGQPQRPIWYICLHNRNNHYSLKKSTNNAQLNLISPIF